METTTLKERYEGHSDKKKFKKEIEKACAWKYKTFFRKINNPGSITELEQEKIDAIINN